jgi:hypothetical protein
MKYIFLALAILIPNTFAQAKNYPLSVRSKEAITFKSMLGGMAGAFVGALGHALVHNPESITYDRSGFGFSLNDDNWCYGTIAGVAALGALATAYYSYINSPEKQFEKAEKILKDFEEDSQIQKALQTEDICNLESWYQLKKVRDLLSHIHSIKIIQKSASFLNFYAVIDESKWDEELDDVLVYHYLQGWILFLQEADQILQEVSKCGLTEIVFTACEYKSKVERYLQTLMKHLESLKANSHLQNDLEQFKRSQKTKQYPYYPTPQPVFNLKPVTVPVVPTTYTPISTPTTTPIPLAPAPMISPVLNGNVYGTIWSNY